MPTTAPLVGRETELGRLDALVARAAAGRGVSALVSGEAGIGKSRLLDALAQSATSAGAVVLRGRAVEGNGPLRPLAQALFRVTGSVPEEDARLAPHRPALARLLPGWPAGTAGPAPLVDPVLLLGEGVLQLLSVLGEGARGGCVLLLDDLHWADADTLAALHHLADAALEHPVAVVGAARDDGERLVLLQRWAAHPNVEPVPLARLPDDAVVALVSAHASTSLRPELVQRVTDAAAGLPLLVEELTRQAESADGAAAQAVPPSLAALVGQRMAPLDTEGRLVLDAVAVLGTAETSLIAAATGLSEASVRAGLRAAVATTLLQTDVDGGLEWRHALMRDAVAAALLPLEKQSLAHKAVEWLSRQPGLSGDRLVLAATLMRTARRHREAAHLLVLAAREATRAGALRTAERTLAEAESLVAGTPQDAAEVALDRVHVLTLSGRAEEARALGLPLADVLVEPLRTRLLLECARAAVAADHHALAAEDLSAAHPETDDPDYAVLAAEVALGTGDADRAAELARVAVRLGAEGDRPEVQCQALEVLGRARRRWDAADAETAFSRAERIATAHGLAAWRVRALAELGTIDLVRTSETARLQRALDLALELGMLGTVAVLHLQIGACVAVREGYVAALSEIEQAVDLAGRLRLRGVEAAALVFVASARAFQERPKEVEQIVDLALRLGEGIVDLPWARCALGVLDWLAGDDDAAMRKLEQGLDPLRRLAAASPTPYWGWWAVMRAASSDDAGCAALAELTDRGLLGHPGNRAALAYGKGLIAARSGDKDGAEALFAEGDGELPTQPFWRHLMHTVLAPSAATLGCGEPEAWLREAGAFADAHGEVAFARRIRAIMRDLGMTVPRGRRGAEPVPASLAARGVTTREHEVLSLVVEGLSNAEIAERLYLSTRTVETHVSSLLTKTGGRNRRDLVAMARSRVRG